jgi:hypothetical protein
MLADIKGIVLPRSIAIFGLGWVLLVTTDGQAQFSADVQSDFRSRNALAIEAQQKRTDFAIGEIQASIHQDLLQTGPRKQAVALAVNSFPEVKQPGFERIFSPILRNRTTGGGT